MSRKSEYDKNYHKSHLKQVSFMLNKNTDQDILAHLEKITNKQGYLKDLIRQDMQNRNL